MFDIGFTELLVVAVVGLLVIGPERLPGAIRTGGALLARLKRSYNEIRQEVERELHNDAVMQSLQQTRQEVERELHNDKVKEALQQTRQEVEKNTEDLKNDFRAHLDRLQRDAGPGKDAGNGSP